MRQTGGQRRGGKTRKTRGGNGKARQKTRFGRRAEKSEITGEEEGTSADADAGVDAADVSPRKGTFL